MIGESVCGGASADEDGNEFESSLFIGILFFNGGDASTN